MNLAMLRSLLSRSTPAALLVLGACTRTGGSSESNLADREVAAPPSRTSAIVSPDAGLAPLGGEWIERLEVEGGRVVYVTPPIGATEARPVVVAIHGAIDDAGLICSAWRLVTDVYPFVVCPAGMPVRKDTYVWPSSEEIGRSIDRALAAVRARYEGRVHTGPVVYAAFSQGANLAGPVLGRSKGTRFARAVLTEGGYRAFETAERARDFVSSGGDRVLFTCSQPGCATWFGASRATLGRGGAEARVTYSGSWGHSMLPAVRESIQREIPWLVDGLEGWESYASAPKLASH
jgi:hypothetical protein